MKTLYLKTDTEQEMIDILINYGFWNEGWSSISYYNEKRIDIDVLGTINKIIESSEDNLVVESLEGFHVNLLWNDDDIPLDISEIMIDRPKTPERVFFGIE